METKTEHAKEKKMRCPVNRRVIRRFIRYAKRQTDEVESRVVAMLHASGWMTALTCDQQRHVESAVRRELTR